MFTCVTNRLNGLHGGSVRRPSRISFRERVIFYLSGPQTMRRKERAMIEACSESTGMDENERQFHIDLRK